MAYTAKDPRPPQKQKVGSGKKEEKKKKKSV